MAGLLEIFLQGQDRHAAEPFNDLETRRVRAALGPDERMTAFVRGRIVQSGAGLWVLTSLHLLVLDLAQRLVRRVPLPSVTALALDEGRYGVTLALQHGQRRLALYAADPGLAIGLGGALAQAVPGLDAAFAAVHAGLKPLQADEVMDAARTVAEAQARVQPALRPAAADVVTLLGHLAALHDRGMLDPTEFTALKGRLLEAA